MEKEKKKKKIARIRHTLITIAVIPLFSFRNPDHLLAWIRKWVRPK